MALFLKNAAASRANKPIPSAYYDGLPGAVRNGKERPNPVIQKLEQEINLYIGYMKKRTSKGYEKPSDEAHSRPSDVLFELWNKYEPLLPKEHFHRKLLEMGDLLVSLQQYSLAERQCYSRYLDAFGDFHVQLITDVVTFKKAFFPDGFESTAVGYTFRALMGRSICMFQAARVRDPMLLSSATVQDCLQILSFLRLVTQVVLPTDRLCWLVYNGTVHIYSICRHLMAYGHSAVVLEFLLWASACMETSVPLMSVKYLTWRTTLYTAVSQCYYDCKAAAHAEAFARRALTKINELSHLEAHSSAVHGPDTAAVFRQATVKMAILVFKRSAFETRKKPKGLLRPKVRANMKDYNHLPWPRTPTEKLLVDMLEGSAAQFLCILETLSDSNRRTLVTSPPAPENEVEMLDVYAELFFAAQEIICGGGGTHMYSAPLTIPSRSAGLVTMPGIVHGKSLIDLAANGQDGVPLSAVIKLVKLAFCYEQWDVYESMAANVYNYIKGLDGGTHLSDQMALELLMAMEHLNAARRRKLEMEVAEREREKEKEREKQERRHAAAAALSDAAGTPVTRSGIAEGGGAEQGRDAAAHNAAEKELQQDGGLKKVRRGGHSKNMTGNNNGGIADEKGRRARATAETGHKADGSVNDDSDTRKGKDGGDNRKAKDDYIKDASGSAITAAVVPAGSMKSFVAIDELLVLARALESISTTPAITPENFDLDMVVDSVLFLWNKCKGVFLKYQTGSNDNVKYLRKMDSPSKWVYVLEVVHQAVGWCGLSHVDPALTAEVTLRLALVIEASAVTKSAVSAQHTSMTNDSEKEIEEDETNFTRYGTSLQSVDYDRASSTQQASSMGSAALLKRTMREQLVAARDILELGLRNVAMSRQVVALNDGRSIADIAWDKKLSNAMMLAYSASTGQAAVPDDIHTKHMLSTSDSVLLATVKLDDQPSAVQPPNEAKPASGDGGAVQAQFIKQQQQLQSKPQYDTSVWVTVKDLHMEMYFVYFKVCMRLSQLRSVPSDTKKSHRSVRSVAMSDCGTPSTVGLPRNGGNECGGLEQEQLLAICGKNSLIKASLLIQRASSLMSHGKLMANEQANLLEEAADLIVKAQADEKRLHTDNNVHAPSSDSDGPTIDVPPPPILLSRSDNTMVFQPATFKPKSAEKVAWYRIFCRSATGSNIKVRLNDNAFQGCGDEVPAFNCLLSVSGLKPQERYVFAVAAYAADGRLIGGAVGDTSRPILASLPLPALLSWSYLAQVSYQTGQYSITKRAAHVLWEHFVSTQSSSGDKISASMPTVEEDFRLTLPRLDRGAVEVASPILLRGFLSSIFMLVDVRMKELSLFCDHLCDMPGSAGHAPAGTSQVARLRQCERLLVAMELAGWLNDASSALQAAVFCYGLLAPLVYWRIPSVAAVQILERCHVVLQEIPLGLRQRRTEKINDSLHHMIACMTYYLAKVLRSRGHKSLAHRISEAGRKLLGPDDGKDRPSEAKDDRSENGATISGDDADEGEEGMLTLAALKKKKGGKAVRSTNARDDETATAGNSELKALEAHLLRLSKQAQGEQELTGNEDPSILHAYITFLPSRIAYKEVVKFKRRARYLEFLVQVVQKAISEGLSQLAVEWCEETLSWIAKRNETVVGSKAIISKQIGAVAIQGDDPKKFAAAVVEFTRQKELLSPRTKGNPSGKQRRKAKFKLLSLPTGLTPEERARQEEEQVKAVEKLALHLPDQFKQASRRRRFRKVCADELPWRSQLNLVLGLSHFRTFLNKLEMREKVLGTKSSLVYSTSFLDPEWFTFETAGVLVVGLSDVSGGVQQRAHDERMSEVPRAFSRHVAGGVAGGGGSKSKFKSKAEADLQQRRNTGIERAAAASTGVIPPPLFPIPEKKQDSPRSTLSNGSPTEERKGSPDMAIMSTQAANEALSQTFRYLCRAVVLAHRGQHWAVLHNATCTLWNCYHTALMRATTYEKPASAVGLLSPDMLRKTVLPSLYMTCDLWLDMLFYMECEHAKREKVSKDEALSFSSGIECERGGLSLRFEPLLDDCASVDLQFSRRLVGCTMGQLFLEQKWEKLIHICFRFLALTGNRFAEQFVPMLVVAQRSLAEQLIQAGELVPQPHMVEAQLRHGGEITPRVYATQMEILLPLLTEDNGARKIICHKSENAAKIDPFAPSLVNDTSLARRLSSVPVDFKATLQLYHDAMSRATYNARALRHSRLLLVLYLGGLQQVAVSEALEPQLELQFSPHAAQPQLPVPPADPTLRSFTSPAELQMVVMSRPQLEIVINSYEKTIELLLAHNQKSLASQALHELGNLAYHSGNTRGAYRWWCDALDLLLNMTDAVSTWHTSLSKVNDVPMELLSRCGVWGCLLGGVLTSNISQYIMTSNLGLRMDCCRLSACFFKAIFRASQPHPTADKDYASYDIGEGCDVAYLVPGIDFLSDRFRADGRGVVSALRWVTEELTRGHHYLFVLPLLTLYQYFASNICRDLQRAVDSRILRVRVLTELAFYKDASSAVLRLLYGERLPNLGDSTFRQVESKMASVTLDTSRPLHDAGNLKIVELLMDKRLSTNLSSFYGPHLTCQLTIAQAHLLISIADTIPAIPAFDIRERLDAPKGGQGKPAAAPAPDGQTITEPQAPSSAALTTADSVALASNIATGVLTPTESLPRSQSTHSKTKQSESRFTNAAGEYSQEKSKGQLLDAAEMMLTTISDTLLDSAAQDRGPENMRAAELELYVQCQLNMATIAQQRHHACIAAHIAFDALKLLMISDVFKERKPVKHDAAGRKSSMKGSQSGAGNQGGYGNVKLTDEQNNQFEFHNYQSRSRLDARLWLECKLTLVKSMLGKNGGMGLIKGPITKVIVEMADCRQYCAEGVAEAEACNDSEMQAEFLMQAALLNVAEGLSLRITRTVVEDVIASLRRVPRLSMSGSLLHARAIVFMADIDCLIGSPMLRLQSEDAAAAAKQIVCTVMEAHDQLLSQMLLLGDTVDVSGAVRVAEDKLVLTPAMPVPNIYLQQAQLLCQAKLRIAHLLACQANGCDNDRARVNGGMAADMGSIQSELALVPQSEQLCRTAVNILLPALQLCRANAHCSNSLLAELLLETGKLQRHLAAGASRQELDTAITTLLEAIQVSHSADHNLSVIRQGYLEVAMAYLSVSSQAYSKRATSANEITLESESTLADMTTTLDDGSSPSGMSIAQDGSRKKKKSLQATALKEKSKIKKSLDAEDEREKMAAMQAIRCAALTMQAQYQAFMMNGDAAFTAQGLTAEEWQGIPQFAYLDLVGDYVVGKKKKLYKSWVEEQMAPLVESMQQEPVPTYEEEVGLALAEARELSWLSLLGYQSILQRLCNHRTITVKRPGSANDSVIEDVDDSDRSPSLAATSLAVHYPLCCNGWVLRVINMHRFLLDKLAAYKERCVAPLPPASLKPTAPGVMAGAALTLSHSRLLFSSPAAAPSMAAAVAGDTTTDQSIASSQLLPSAALLASSFARTKEKTSLPPPLPDNELVVQWYAPSHEPQLKKGNVCLLYAVSKKGKDTRSKAKYYTGVLWVPVTSQTDLHLRLVELVQKAEILLVDGSSRKSIATPLSTAPQAQPVSGAAAAQSKQKSSTALASRSKLKAQSPKLKKDEAIETLLRQILVDCYQMFGATWPLPSTAQQQAPTADAQDSELTQVQPQSSGSTQDQPDDAAVKIPFEITRSNLKALERLFNVSYGNIVPSGKLFTWLFNAIPSEKVS